MTEHKYKVGDEVIVVKLDERFKTEEFSTQLNKTGIIITKSVTLMKPSYKIDFATSKRLTFFEDEIELVTEKDHKFKPGDRVDVSPDSDDAKFFRHGLTNLEVKRIRYHTGRFKIYESYMGKSWWVDKKYLSLHQSGTSKFKAGDRVDIDPCSSRAQFFDHGLINLEVKEVFPIKGYHVWESDKNDYWWALEKDLSLHKEETETYKFKVGDIVDLSPDSPDAQYFINGLTNLKIGRVISCERYDVLESNGNHSWHVDECYLSLHKEPPTFNLHQRRRRKERYKFNDLFTRIRMERSRSTLNKEEKKMKLENIKKENLKEAKKQYEKERTNAEVEFAKDTLSVAQDCVDNFDRQIRDIEVKKEPYLKTIKAFNLKEG